MQTIEYIIGHFLIIGVISAILLMILTGFVLKFVLPALRIQTHLRSAAQALKEMKAASKAPITDLSKISREILCNDMFTHPWQEYQETLHAQKAPDASGAVKTVRYRSTALAEVFFSEQALVDTPLRTEFYKHVPGILTGLGIIGTFSGLIVGLIRFEVSGDADKVRASLNGLIQSVGYSFVVSAAAITLSMIFIWLEKSLSASCYRYVEKLCQGIDTMFAAGAGEEYLSRLVAAAESSVSRPAGMNDGSLAGELRQIMSEMAKQQMRASAVLNRQLSESISHTLSESVREPLERISHAVETTGAKQGETVNTLVAEALTGFADRMNGMLGDKLQGIGELLQQTTVAMQGIAIQVTRLSENLQLTEEGAAHAMTASLNTALASMEARQQAMDAHMVEFIGQVGNLAHGSQSQASKDIEAFVSGLGEKVTDIISRLETQSGQAAKEYGARQVQLTRFTNTAMGEITSQVQALAAEMRQASEVMRGSVASLSQNTKESLVLFSTGANTLNNALNGFAKVGQGVNNTMAAAAKATDTIGIASSNLMEATKGVQAVMDDYRNMSRLFAATVAELKTTIESARQEASLTTQIVSRLQKAAEHLGIAESRAGEYLSGVTEVLTQAHAEFAGNIEMTLRKSNSQFHEELSRSVSLISGAIQDFGDVIDSVMEKGELRCSA